MVKCSLCRIKIGFCFFNIFYKIFKLMVINNIIIMCSFCYNFYFYVVGIEVLVGFFLYKYQYKEIFFILVKDFKNEYFIEKLELFYGFYMFVVLGVLYGFVVVFEFVVLIKNYVKYEKEVNVVRLLN